MDFRLRRKHPLHWKEMLGKYTPRIEQKSSGGMTEGTVPLAPALPALQCTWR